MPQQAACRMPQQAGEQAGEQAGQHASKQDQGIPCGPAGASGKVGGGQPRRGCSALALLAQAQACACGCWADSM